MNDRLFGGRRCLLAAGWRRSLALLGGSIGQRLGGGGSDFGGPAAAFFAGDVPAGKLDLVARPQVREVGQIERKAGLVGKLGPDRRAGRVDGDSVRVTLEIRPAIS